MKIIFKKIVLIFLYSIFSFSFFIIPNNYTFSLSQNSRIIIASNFVNQYEQNLHNSYINSTPVSSEEWNSVTTGKDIYNVQQNDTLWSISKILFGNGHYWPKLWSVNPNITNPHLIRPKDNISFTKGTQSEAPIISSSIVPSNFLDIDKESKPKNKKVDISNIIKLKKIKIPNSKKIIPVLNHIPSSLPYLKLVQAKKTDDQNIQVTFMQMDNIKVQSYIPYYMSDKHITGDGIISSNKEFGSVFHTGQIVIITMKESVELGQKLLIVKDKGKLYPDQLGIRGPFGYQIEVQGELKIINRVEDSSDTYEAQITKTLNPITIGAMVLNKNIMQFDYNSTNNAGDTKSQIIGTPSLIGDSQSPVFLHSIVFLNRGTSSGISVEQMYQIKSNPDFRLMKFGYDIKVGELKIIKAESDFSTGLITKLTNPIYIGDKVIPLNKDIVLDNKQEDNFAEDEDTLEPNESKSEDESQEELGEELGEKLEEEPQEESQEEPEEEDTNKSKLDLNEEDINSLEEGLDELEDEDTLEPNESKSEEENIKDSKSLELNREDTNALEDLN